MSSNHYSQLQRQVKVDPETRSYQFLMKIHEKNPMSGLVRNTEITLEIRMKYNTGRIKGRFFFKPTKKKSNLIRLIKGRLKGRFFESNKFD